MPFLLCVERFNRLGDDAFIDFRYARNLAQGHGLVFNPGEAPVEGFAGPLWVLLLALVERLGGDVTIWSRALSIACGALLLALLTHTLTAELRLSRAAALLGALWAAAMPPLTVWSTGGLSTMLHLLLLFVCYQRLLARPRAPDGWGAGLAGVAVVVTRFDGLGFVAAVLAVGVLGAWRTHDLRLGKATARACGTVVLGVAALELWRWSYFGQLLPNVVYVKVGFGPFVLARGAHYLARFATVFPVALLVAGVAIKLARGIASPATAGAAALVAAACAHALLVGGDFMPMFRFLVPAVPFLAILLAASFDVWWRQGREGRRLAAGLSVIAMLGALLPALGIEPLRHVTRRVLAAGAGGERPASQAELVRRSRDGLEPWIELGHLLAEHVPAGSTLVQAAVGAVGYYSDLTILDQFGLTDRELARTPAEQVPSSARHIGGHDKFGSVAFFEPRRPDYAFANVLRADELANAEPSMPRRVFRGADERFLALYRPVLIPLADGERYLLLAERDPDPDDGDNGWREPLLRPENVRAPSETRGIDAK